MLNWLNIIAWMASPLVGFGVLKLSLATQSCRRYGVADVRPLLRVTCKCAVKRGKRKNPDGWEKVREICCFLEEVTSPEWILLGVAELGCRCESIDSATG